MFMNCGRSPELNIARRAVGRSRIIFLLLVTGVLLAFNAEAQQRVVLTLAEAEDSALAA